MLGGARHELNVCRGRRDRMSILKLKHLLFGPGLVVVQFIDPIDVFSIFRFLKWHSMMAFMEKIVDTSFVCTTNFLNFRLGNM